MNDKETYKRFEEIASVFPCTYFARISCHCGCGVEAEGHSIIQSRRRVRFEAVEEGWTLEQHGQTAEHLPPDNLLYRPVCPNCSKKDSNPPDSP